MVATAKLIDEFYRDGENNRVNSPTINSINPAALAEGTAGAYVAGGGTPNNGNHLGRVAKPNQAYGGNATEWTDDTAYGALTGTLLANASNVAAIGGGYDNICNQIAGTIAGGGHNYIKYNINGHSVQAGGSYNLTTGGRCFGGGGRNNWMAGDFSAVVCGDNNWAIGNNSVAFNGSGLRLSGAASGGLGTNITTGTLANSSFAMGADVYLNGAQSCAFGRDAYSQSSYSFTLAAQKPSGGVQGACQTHVLTGGCRTTNATLTSCNGGLLIGNAEDFAGVGTVYISGVDEATNNVVLVKQDIGFKMVAGTTTFYLRTGDNTTQSSTNTAPGSTAETMTLTPFVDEITVGTLQLRATSGTAATIIVRVTGAASTNITWTCSLVLAVSKIA